MEATTQPQTAEQRAKAIADKCGSISKRSLEYTVLVVQIEEALVDYAAQRVREAREADAKATCEGCRRGHFIDNDTIDKGAHYWIKSNGERKYGYMCVALGIRALMEKP